MPPDVVFPHNDFSSLRFAHVWLMVVDKGTSARLRCNLDPPDPFVAARPRSSSRVEKNVDKAKG
jgi:hypothetical protein